MYMGILCKQYLWKPEGSAAGTLELELQLAVSHYIDVRNQIWVPPRSASVFNHVTEPSLKPHGWRVLHSILKRGNCTRVF